MKKIYAKLGACFFALSTMVCVFNGSIDAFATEVTEPVEEQNQPDVQEIGIANEADQDEAEADANNEVVQLPVQNYSGAAIVEVSNYSLEGGILAAGKDISIMLNLHNLSSSTAAESVMLTLSSDSGMIYPSYGNDNQIFVGTIAANESIEVAVPITVSPSFTGDAVDLKCQFDYGSSGTKMINSTAMILTTSGGNKINVKSIDVSTHAIVNGKTLISINYSNKSNANITDAQLVIDGNVTEESKSIKLDTVYSGKSYSKDYNVTFTQTGNQEINIKLVYTDGAGEHVEYGLGKYSVSVNDETFVENNENNTLDSVLLWGGRIVAGIVLIIAGFVVLKYLKEKF